MRGERRGGDSGLLRLGSALLAVASLGLLAAPLTIMAAIPDLTTRSSRHLFAGAAGLAALAVTEGFLALVPVRRGEKWALVAAALPFVIVGVPVLVVDATYVARERLWNTLAPQGFGLLVGAAALALCAVGRRTAVVPRENGSEDSRHARTS